MELLGWEKGNPSVKGLKAHAVVKINGKRRTACRDPKALVVLSDDNLTYKPTWPKCLKCLDVLGER